MACSTGPRRRGPAQTPLASGPNWRGRWTGRSTTVAVWSEGWRARSSCATPRFRLGEAAAYEAVLVLGAARVQTLLLIEEPAAALHHARDFCRWHQEAILGLTSAEIASARWRPGSGRRDLGGRPRQAAVAGTALAGGGLGGHLHVGARPAAVRSLIDRGVRGRDHVHSLREG